MRQNNSWKFVLTLGGIVAAGAAQATLSTTLVNNLLYETSSTIAGAPGATGSPTGGGLCPAGTIGCPALPPAQAGGLDANGLIDLSTQAAYFDGDSNYSVLINVTDRSKVAGSYYEITLDGVSLGTTPIVAVRGGTFSSGSFSLVLADGLVNAKHILGLTNVYLETNSSLGGYSYSVVAANVTVTPAPEPASILLLTAGLGMLGALRRRRASGV